MLLKIIVKKKSISFKPPNDVLVNGKKICGILQELITSKSKKFLIVGIGINIVSHPNINSGHKATNIFLESKINPSIGEMMDKIVFSYEKFFLNLNSYNYLNFKKKLI